MATKRLKLRVRWKEATLEDFVARHADLFEAERVFLQTRQPLALGTEVSFEFLLAGGVRFFEGNGVIDELVSPVAGSQVRPGMFVRFRQLSQAAAVLVAEVLDDHWDDETPVHPFDPSEFDDAEQEVTASGFRRRPSGASAPCGGAEKTARE